MLVLTRKNGERILIGDDVVVKVVRICGRQVRIGIEVPTGTRILRGELVLSGTEPGAQEGDQEKTPAA